jgi:cyclomaltodextrinase / maltogenic alpha-amylase / neopullulanase
MHRGWLRDGVIYEIFPRNFSPEGDLPGVTRRIDQLAFMGVDVLWLMPIHPIGALHRKGPLGSPYSIADHRAVDPAAGTMDDLRELVTVAHRHGLRVIMDFVGNHGAWDGVVAQEHPEWILRDAQGAMIPAKPQWKDVVGFDLQNTEVRRYLVETLLHWVREADVDGFRCDVAGLLPLSFWEEARAALDQVKPDAGLLAEAHDPALMDVFDLCYDTPLYGALRRIIRGGAPAQQFWEARDRFLADFPAGAGRMTYIENHDQRRSASYLSSDAGSAAAAAAVLLLTFEGTPLLYAGQEVGSCASTHRGGLFEARPIDWATATAPWTARDVLARDPWILYQHLLWIRSLYPALHRGGLRPLEPGHPGVVAFERTRPQGCAADEKEFVVAVNLTPEPAAVRFDEFPSDLRRDLLSHGGAIRCHPYGASENTLDPWGWIISVRP